MSMKFRKESLRATVLAMDTTRISAAKATHFAVASGGAVFLTMVRANVGLRDHTLKDLARQGHPYAVRQGSIGIHAGGSNTMVNPQFRVHQQSGALLNATRGRMLSGSQPRYRVAVDTGIAPHAKFVILGTRVMLPRDVIWDTANARATQKAIRKQMVSAFGPILRSKAILRIPPLSPSR